MLLMRPSNPRSLPRHALAAAILSLGLAGCTGTPGRTAHPSAVAPFSDGSGERDAYASAGAYGLAAPRPPLISALNDHYEEWAGVPYRYGGNSKNGIDCSAFVRRTVAAIRNLLLPRTTRAQAQRGRAVERGDLRVGDLVFFKTGPDKRHVGIYIGDGRFMHASSSRGVTISELSNIYWRRHYWQARRLTGN